MLTVKTATFDEPVARALMAAALAELARRYDGDGDVTPMRAGEFVPPHGCFLVAYIGPAPAGCGGWRTRPDDPGLAEIKRMYTAPDFQRRGVARAVLTALEDSARAAGRRRIVLETGLAQPEAMALYESCGYERIAGFGHYRDHADCVSYGRDLR